MLTWTSACPQKTDAGSLTLSDEEEEEEVSRTCMTMQFPAQEKRKCGGQTSAGVDFFAPTSPPSPLPHHLLNFNGEASK